MNPVSASMIGRQERRAIVFGIALLALPIVVTAVVGTAELVRRGESLLVITLSALCFAAGFLVLRRAIATLRAREQRILSLVHQGAEPQWSDRSRNVWEDVARFAESIRSGTRPIDSIEELRAIFETLARDIAVALHPRSDLPLLEFTLGDLALASENAVRDLRVMFVERLPFHGEIRIADYRRGRTRWEQARSAYDIYRMLRATVNPLGALLGELQGLLTRRLLGDISDDTTRFLLAASVELVGKHLISLYAGEVLAPEAAPESAASGEHATLTISIAGETNAGKSSLINALFGDELSRSSPLPETPGFIQLRRELDDVGEVVLVDSPGYGTGSETPRVLSALVSRAGESDLFILTTPASSAARATDRELLERIRELPAPPELVVALTKIDLLRPFGRWSPPYDLERPEDHAAPEDRQKAVNIRGAVLAVAEELNVPTERVLPLMVKDPASAYNVDLLAALTSEMLPSLRRSLFRRVLRDQKDDRLWSSLSTGLRSSGRFLVRRTVDYALKQIRD